MGFRDRYKLADDIIPELDKVLATVADPFVASRYAGFLAVSAVTVYELAVKQIFREFAELNHRLLGNYVAATMARINGRISIGDLKKDYLSRFGTPFVNRFDRALAKIDFFSLRRVNMSVKSSYNNIILYRNQFAHEGQLPATATYAEVKQFYASGKIVIECLDRTLNHRNT